jgi:long-chain acyl-CoA synthetase
VPNKDELLNFARSENVDNKSPEGELKLLNLIQSEIDKFKDGGEFAGMFPQRWIPSAVAILGEGFSEQNKFLNSTLKMVRGKITEFYRSRIDFLFTPEGKNIDNHQNRKIINRMG